MNKLFSIEEEGQRYFYETYLPRIDSSLSIEDVIEDNSDGILNGNILEFKLGATDLNAHLAQMVKYQSSRRIKGKPLPANMILISLNTQKIYLYRTEDYLDKIEQVYFVSASKDNMGFIAEKPHIELNYSLELDESKMIKLLKTNDYTKINIDENCIVGWANSYYRINKGAAKADFIGDLTGHTQIIGEIRRPTIFKKYINPYKGENNVQFQYLMDRLNDDLQKKNLGAFYTPLPYALKSIELLREAIDKVPEGNDYIILDRCAGTGNLEQQLTDEELSHVILSTVEYYEYKVLIDVIGDKVRDVIPPRDYPDTFNQGLVHGADALSQGYVENPIIKQYLDRDDCTIILFENPPYAETTSIEWQKNNKSVKSNVWKDSYVVEEMRKDIKGKGMGSVLNDLSNAFIWSAFKFYLRQPTDSYIVYGPVMYWKSNHLINKQFNGGFAFNRRHFHTNTNATIMCASWSNVDSDIDEIELNAFDINADGGLVDEGIVPVKRIYTKFSQKYYDKRKFEDNLDGIVCNLNGTEREGDKGVRIPRIYNENLIGYMAVHSVSFDNARTHSSLLVAGRYDGNGFFLRKDNFLEKLPMFATSRYTDYNNNWKVMSMAMKSGDGSEQFHKDVRSGKANTFLTKTLLWTTLTHYNKIRSLYGSDERFYRNELSLDITNGPTIASKHLNEQKLNQVEVELIEQWGRVMNAAKNTKNYNKKFTYGLFQIDEELNTKHKDEKGNNIPDYPELQGYINSMKAMLKKYYIEEIQETLFHYKFVV